MNNELTVFENTEFGQITAIEMNDVPWFVAKDVADILEYSQTQAMLKRLDDNEKVDHPFWMVSLKQYRNKTVISESGLYKAIFGSKMPKAKEFQDWVFKEVLPSIRKTGSYNGATASSPKTPVAVVELKACIEMAEIFGFTGNQGLLSANKAVKKLHDIDCMALLDVHGLETPGNRQFFTPTQLGKKIGVSAVKFNKLLREVKLQDKVDKGPWIVTSVGKKHCQVLDTNKRNNNGTPVQQIKWCEDVLPLVSSVLA